MKKVANSFAECLDRMDIVNAKQSTSGNAEACVDKGMTFLKGARKIRNGSKAEVKKNNENVKEL